MAIAAVLSQHTDEAAFLWTTRNRATRDPRVTLAALGRLDRRLESHLHGLRVAGESAWRFCEGNLVDGGAGAVFVLALLAFEAADRKRMLQALEIGCASRELLSGLVSALAWLDGNVASQWIQRLVEARSAVHRRVGIAALAIRREDPGSALTAALRDANEELRARALRAVGELRRHDLQAFALNGLEDESEGCRFWATWTLALFRRPEGLRALEPWLSRTDGYGRHARQLAMRAMELGEGRRWIRTFASEPLQLRYGIESTGLLGDPAAVPWLIKMMESPALARAAGDAFTMITGADLEDQALTRKDVPDLDDFTELPATEEDGAYDSGLPWPSPPLIARWWDGHGSQFAPGTRYLAGRPLSLASARDVLVTGTQTQRASAAIELALRGEDEMLFEVRGRSSLQRRLLNGTPRVPGEKTA